MGSPRDDFVELMPGKMRSIVLWSSALLCLGGALPAFAQSTTDSTSKATTTIVIARTGIRLDAPHVGTYHYVEVIRSPGRWIYPDVGYLDFATNAYRELFAGGGLALRDSKRMTLIQELFFDQAFGPAARSARYLVPWTMLQIRFTPKFASETVYFPYVPLNRAARIQHILERAKVEYAIKRPWKSGVGYGGYQYGDLPWQHRPFLTTTLSTRVGAFEFWLQRMPRGAQVQFRYLLVHTSGR